MATEFHEDRETLDGAALDMKRAIDSMREELEAVDWYRQRMLATQSPELRALLDHHQREEIEHFAMLLEWCRRNDADFAEQLRAYLFREGDIIGIEADETGGEPAAPDTSADRRVTIGSLRSSR